MASWERFEEQTKLAFVGDAPKSRFFLKTRVSKGGVNVVSRVVHQGDKGAEAVKYVSGDAANLSRLSRLLRFVMQEVLGPMKAQTPMSPAVKPVAAPVPADKKKPKKKKKAKK